MLRLLVLTLLLANAIFFAWTQGQLDPIVGVKAIGDREPERLSQQVRPQDLIVLSPQAASSAARPAPPPMECLEAGPFTAAQMPAAEASASAAVPGLTWARRQVDLPGSWALVMGPFPSRELLEKKQEELKRTRVSFEELKAPPAFSGALSLGLYESANAATAALAQLSTRGIKTARVAQLSAPQQQVFLRGETTDVALLAQARSLKTEPWTVKPFSPCP